MTPNTKRRLAAIAAFGLPLGIIFVLGNMLGDVTGAEAVAPATAVVDPVPAPVSAPPPVTAQPTIETSGPVELRVAELRAIDDVVSPFSYPEVVPEDEAPEMPDVLPPEFKVQGVMKLRDGTMIAFIDGTRVGVGDHIEGGDWEVTDIDQMSRTVEITHAVTGASHRR